VPNKPTPEEVAREARNSAMGYPKKEVKAHNPTPEEVATAQRMDYRRPNKSGLPIKHINKQERLAKFYNDPTLTMDIFTLRKIPISDASIDQMAARLVKWILTTPKTKIVFADFLRIEGRDFTSFKNLKKRSEKLEAAYKFAMMCIGATREKGMLLNKLNASGVIASMPIYSQQWKELAEWKSALQQKSNEQTTTKFVVLEKAAQTSVVPPLKSVVAKAMPDEKEKDE